jgi:diguanylate cyclase (GGDEF)-like protein
MLARAALIIGFPESYPRFIAPHPLNFAHLLLLNASLVLGTVGFLLAHRDEAEQALVRLASVDALTGLLNRREWWSRAQLALQRGGPAPALLLLDLDHFKAVNDQHGHPVGDRVLALTGEVLSSHTRASDLAGRYGGEEFCLLLRAPDGPVLRAIDERLHEALRDKSLAALGFAVDFSAGAVRVQPGETLDAAVQRADQALYRAKGNGRAQTCWADTPL